MTESSRANDIPVDEATKNINILVKQFTGVDKELNKPGTVNDFSEKAAQNIIDIKNVLMYLSLPICC